ncbi:MFS transporter [Streptomyces sp. WMMC500]|uniref:MFS transporter n=1 Tax=Streptomyces sp. WMMC500 TaxID=3015154 RepID=UPI00248CBFF9|nr:MFS transporter [Streptomyces sp. WMMC500]WBB61171.1 MFS transporter [Streptomyces sp. WMMC500]
MSYEPSPARLRRPGPGLALLALGHLVISLDLTIVFVALPHIAADVGFTAHTQQWVVSVYAVLYGGFLLLGGRLSDLLGRRRMFVTGMVLYGAASVLGGLATAPGVLLAARGLQGLGGAVLFPAVLTLVNTAFAEGRERNRALTVWAMAGAGGLTVGSLAGGVLTQAFGWEAVFFVNVPMAALGAVGAFALLPADGPAARGGIDVPGALTGTAGVTLLIFAIAHGSEAGWAAAEVVAAAALAPLLLGVFLRTQARGRHPLMPLGVFRNRALGAASVVIVLFGFTTQAVPYFLTLYFQSVLGFSALETGLAFLGPTLAITAGNALSEKLVHRFGNRASLIAGILLNTAGGLLLAPGFRADGSFLTVLAGIVVVGLGMGITFECMWIAAGTGVAGEEQGLASGVASTALQIGTATGIAVFVAIANRGVDGRVGQALREATADGMRTATFVLAVALLPAVLAALALPRGENRVVAGGAGEPHGKAEGADARREGQRS